MLKVGIVGCGMIGKEHAKRLQYKIRGCEVVAVCDVFEASARETAAMIGGVKVFTDADALISDPDVDAVVVTTPGQFHKGPILSAIKAGKPVFSEKPLTTTAADCKEIVDAEMASGKHLVQVGFMRRYDRGYNGAYDRSDQERDYYSGPQYSREPSREELAALNEAPRRQAAPINDPVKLRIPQEVLDAHGGSRKLLMHITDMISLFPGDRDVLVYLPGQKPVRCSADKRVRFTDVLKAKLVRMLGEENVKG